MLLNVVILNAKYYCSAWPSSGCCVCGTVIQYNYKQRPSCQYFGSTLQMELSGTAKAITAPSFLLQIIAHTAGLAGQVIHVALRHCSLQPSMLT